MSDLLGKNELGAPGSADRLPDLSTSPVQKPNNNTTPQASGAPAAVPDQAVVKSPAAIPETIFSASLGASVHDSPKNLINIFMKFVETSLPLPRKADLTAAALTFAKTLGITKEEPPSEESVTIVNQETQERKAKTSSDNISSQGNFTPTVSLQSDNNKSEKARVQTSDDMDNDYDTPNYVASGEEEAGSVTKITRRRNAAMASNSRAFAVNRLSPVTENEMGGFGGNKKNQQERENLNRQSETQNV